MYLVVERRGERGVGRAVEGAVVHGQEGEEDEGLLGGVGVGGCV